MRHLIDAHTLIWALDDPAKLGASAVVALQDPTNELLVSAGTIWEMSIKCGLAKLTLSLPFLNWMERALGDLGVTLLPITVNHADQQAQLPLHHRDPFDRLLVAQALVEGASIVSIDVVFEQYGVQRVW